MKIKFHYLPAVLFSFLFTQLNAQHSLQLRSVNDSQLKQLLKEHKNVHFVRTNGPKGGEIKFYVTPPTAKNVASPAPVINNTSAADFHLTKDINAQTDANPLNSDFVNNNPYAIVNNVMYFSANDGIHGAELWRSDGTAAGTYMVIDLEPGVVSSTPSEILVVNNKLFFVTQNPSVFSFKLWSSDGTAGGTIMLKDLITNGPGINGSFNLTNVSGTVYFFIMYNPQLWKTDGTVANTVLVKDFSADGTAPFLTTAANGLLYFTLYTNSNGRELWRSDGSNPGTFLVKDISASFDFLGGPYQLTPFNNKLYFTGDDATGRKLWFTDGTEAGTAMASGQNNVMLSTDFLLSLFNKPFIVQGNDFYTEASAAATGNELYKYNTTAGFTLVKDLTPGAAGGFFSNITVVKNYMAFQYQDTLNKRNELWASDGTSAHTVLIKAYDDYSSYFLNLTAGNNLLYFVSYSTGNGQELWETSGTANSTVMVKDIYAGATSSFPASITLFKHKMYFSAASKRSGSELWQTDGTETNTSMLLEINSITTSSSAPNYGSITSFYGINPGAALKTMLYFPATKPETGYELYGSDGTNAGTSLVTELASGENGSSPQSFMHKNNSVYFIAYSNEVNIYKIDSSGTLTKLVSSPALIISYDVDDAGLVYYTEYNPATSKIELWRSDGTVNGNFMLNDEVSNYFGNNIVKVAGNKAYFTAADEHGIELWVSGGTAASTKLIKDIYKGSSGSNPFSLYAYKNYIVFGANDSSGNALWRTDGTAGGTIKLKSIVPYGFNGYAQDYNDFFCIVNDVLYLNAYTDINGAELWKTNATKAGTVLVKDLTGDANGSNPWFLTNVNGTLFFAVSNYALWKSDGTGTGTVLVKNISSSDYYLFTERCVADGKLFFNTDHLLWVSDGTDAGTHQVFDNGLNGVSNVKNLVAAISTVFFNGHTDKYGDELYAGDAAKVTPSFSFVNNKQNDKQPSFRAVVLQNPVTASVKLRIQSLLDQTIDITVSDERGIVVAHQKINAGKGDNTLSINCANWQTGVYVVNLSGSKGEAVSINVLK